MKLSKTLLQANLILFPIAAFAAPLTTDKEFQQKAGYFDTGPVRIYPALVTKVGYDDNIFESNRNEVDSVVTHVIPEIAALVPFNTASWLFGAQADASTYSESSDDNFVDRQLFARGSFEPGYRHRFNLRAGYNQAHEDRGTVLTEGIDPETTTVNEPDEFTQQSLGLMYEFGARTAKGRLRLSADYLDHSYDNHRDRTRFFDRDEKGYGAAFLWRAFPNTALVLEGRQREIEYSEQRPGEASLDSTEHTALVGAEWDATGQTTNSVRIGHKRKNFSASERVDGSNMVWELGTTWRPRSYSSFDFDIRRTPNETNGTGDFIDTKSYSVKWSHDWLPRFGTEVTLSRTQESYQSSTRDSKSNGAQVGFKYEMRRWLTWRLDASWRERTSNVDLLEFERNRYWLTAQFTL